MRIPNCRSPLGIALLATLVSPAVHALALTDAASLDGYAGLATVTVSREGPTDSSTHSGTASPSVTYVMGWTGGSNDYAHSVALGSGAPSFSIDFGAMLAGSAPTSLGSHAFDLTRAPVPMDINAFDFEGQYLGDVAGILALAEGAKDYAIWSEVVTRGVFVARYHLVLFDVSGNETSSGGSSVVQPIIDVSVGPNIVVTAVPEPGVLGLCGIGLAGLAANRRRKGIRAAPAETGDI